MASRPPNRVSGRGSGSVDVCARKAAVPVAPITAVSASAAGGPTVAATPAASGGPMMKTNSSTTDSHE